jgi:hypothetical protein
MHTYVYVLRKIYICILLTTKYFCTYHTIKTSSLNIHLHIFILSNLDGTVKARNFERGESNFNWCNYKFEKVWGIGPVHYLAIKLHLAIKLPQTIKMD